LTEVADLSQDKGEDEEDEALISDSAMSMNAKGARPQQNLSYNSVDKMLTDLDFKKSDQDKESVSTRKVRKM
jgi:hypothetical protein